MKSISHLNDALSFGTKKETDNLSA